MIGMQVGRWVTHTLGMYTQIIQWGLQLGISDSNLSVHINFVHTRDS